MREARKNFGNRKPETGKNDFCPVCLRMWRFCKCNDSEIPETNKSCPSVRAIADYHEHGCAAKYREHLIDHLANGYVFSTPSVFVMFKAVQLDDERIAWYVTYFNGDLQTLLSLLPFPLPFIAFRRYRHGRERLRTYQFERFLKLAVFLSGIRNPQSEISK